MARARPCPRCGTSVPAESSRCARCGHPLPGRRLRNAFTSAHLSLALGLLALVVPALVGLLGLLLLPAQYESDPCHWAMDLAMPRGALGLLFAHAFVLVAWVAVCLPLAIPAVVLGLKALVGSLMRPTEPGRRNAAICGLVFGLIALVPLNVPLYVPQGVAQAIAERLCEAEKRKAARTSDGALPVEWGAQCHEPTVTIRASRDAASAAPRAQGVWPRARGEVRRGRE